MKMTGPVKALTKNLLDRAVTTLPAGPRDFLIRSLCKDQRPPPNDHSTYHAFIELATGFHVTALKVSGEYGVIQSTVDDVEILGAYAKTGHWAKRTNDLLTQFFSANPTGTYVDVGANIGLTVIPVAQRRTVACYAIEADPTNFANLVTNVAANCPHGNVTAKHLAVFSRRCSLPLEIAPENRGDHRIRLKNEPGVLGEQHRRTIDVDAAPLDDIVPPFAGTAAIKIDTQGAEPFVIEGGARTLAQAQLLVLEFWPYGISRLGGDPGLIMKLLRDQYRTASIAMVEEEPLAPATSTASAVAELERLVNTKHGDISCYLDVVAYK